MDSTTVATVVVLNTSPWTPAADDNFSAVPSSPQNFHSLLIKLAIHNHKLVYSSMITVYELISSNHSVSLKKFTALHSSQLAVDPIKIILSKSPLVRILVVYLSSRNFVSSSFCFLILYLKWFFAAMGYFWELFENYLNELKFDLWYLLILSFLGFFRFGLIVKYCWIIAR